MNHSKKHIFLLPMVIFLAFVAHIFAILFLQGMKVHFDSPNRGAWFERQFPQKDVGGEYVKSKDLKRQNDLVKIFEKVVEKPSDMPIHRDSRMDVFEGNLESPPIEDLLEPVHFSEDLFLSKENTEMFFDKELPVSKKILEESIHDPIDMLNDSSKMVVFSEEDVFTDSLAQATSLIRGEVLVEDVDSIAALKGIKVGLAENLPISGRALQNKSGLLDIKINEEGASYHPKLFFSSSRNSNLQASLEEDLGEGKMREESVLSSLSLVKNNFMMKEPLTEDFMEKAPEFFDEQGERGVASIASSEDFLLDVTCAPKKGGKGYVFKLSFLPREGVVFKRIKQNVFFLIDRSHSIDKVRYDLSRKAVEKSLLRLNSGDTFNILVFDDNVVRLSESNLFWTRENFLLAQKFLSEQEHGGFFASTDIYASLGKIIPDVVADNEVNTAILLSDGDTYLRRNQQRRTIGEWTRKNQGKVALFSVASGRRNNLALLELLSFFNKGKLVYASSYRHLDEAMLKLTDVISSPIGKDIVVTAIPSNDSMHVNVYPYSSRFPDLYEKEPYAVYGDVDCLEDFYVFLQGKYYDKWLDIKQKVSFKDAVREEGVIERDWAIHRAYDYYHLFLNDGNYSHLGRAKKILDPFDIRIAFQ